MANTIRIKRSASTNEPTSLAQGELANSESGSPNGINELWVGTTGPTVYKLVRNLNGSPAEPTAGLAAATPVTADYMVFEDVTDSQGKRVLFSSTPLSIFSNDSGWEANQTITTGLAIDGADAGSSGNITLDWAPSELAVVTPVTGDYFVFQDVSDTDTPKRQLASSIPLSIFNNDAGFTPEAIHANFDFSTTTTAADPGSGNLRFNNATPASVTAIYVDDLQNDTTNAGWLLDNIAVDDIVTIRSVSDPLDYLIVQITSVTDNVGWFNFGVSVLGSGTLPGNTDALQFDVDWTSQSTNQTITTGLGIDGADAGSTGNITLDFAPVELTNLTPVAADEIVISDTSDSGAPKTSTVSSFTLDLWGDAAGQVGMADQDLNRPVLEDYGVKHTSPTVSGNAVTVDCTLGNSFTIDMDPATAAVTLTLSNPSASGTYCEVNLTLIMGTPAYGITWPGSVVWQNGGTAPNLTTTNNVVDIVHLYTVDGGTTWYGTYALAAAAGGAANQTITTGTGITGADAGTAGNFTMSLDFDEVAVTTATGADWIMFDDAGVSSKFLISSFDVGLFNNATAEYVSENDSIVVVDWNWVLDEDTMTSNSATHVPTQQSVKAYVDAAVTSGMTYKGGYNAATNTPALDTGTPTLEVGDTYTVTAAGNFFTEAVEVGDVLIAEVDSTDAAQLSDWTILQNNIGAASETEAGYIEIATQAEVDAASSTVLAVVPNYLHNTTFDGGTF